VGAVVERMRTKDGGFRRSQKQEKCGCQGKSGDRAKVL